MKLKIPGIKTGAQAQAVATNPQVAAVGGTLTGSNISIHSIYTTQTAGVANISVGAYSSRNDWTKDEWMDYLREYENSEGFQQAISTMNSKLYKELK